MLAGVIAVFMCVTMAGCGDSSDKKSKGSSKPESLPEEAAVDILINGEKNVSNSQPLLMVTVNGYDDDNLTIGGSF